MSLIDFILNLVTLWLWLSWRSFRADPLHKTTPATLAGTLRRAEPRRLRSWHFLVALAGLLFLRGLLYWQIGPAVNWTPSIRLVSIALSFRSDFPDRMLLFSALSFVIALAVFYLCMLLLSLAAGLSAETNPVQRFLRVQLGMVSRWPSPIKLLLPLLIGSAFWFLLNPLLTLLSIVPSATPIQRAEQALLIGLGAYLIWKYLIIGILLLALLSSYVYLGNHWFWSFISTASHNLLAPLHWLPLRFGKVDLAPLAGIVAVFLLAYFGERGLVRLYEQFAL